MKIELNKYPGGDATVIEVGSIHISAILINGKTCLTITALGNSDFIQVQPSTGNSINVIAGNDIRSKS